jgi:predicted RNA-binding protein with TRAM domain
MVPVPDSLRSLFTTAVTRRDGTYVLEVPASEVEAGALREGATYRIAVLEDGDDDGDGVESAGADASGRGATARATSASGASGSGSGSASPARSSGSDAPTGPARAPPVSEGERRTVTVESVGEQGDGIAKVDRGYVLIVPDGEPGEEVVVEVDTVKQNVAFTEVVRRPVE